MALMHRALRRSSGSWRPRATFTTATAPVFASDEFLQLAAEPTTPAAVSRRVLQYLEIPLADEENVPRWLPPGTAHAPAVVAKLVPLVRWGYAELDKPEARAVMTALEPWTNMVRDQAWRQFYLRQFLLAHAPLSAYLDVYETHRAVLSRTRKDTVKNPLPTALIVKEFCWRGRFDEALTAYAELPMRAADRNQIVALLQDYEQFDVLLGLYKAHRQVKPALPPLDVVPRLNALAKLGRRDEMERNIQQLSSREQSRPEIQDLLAR